MAHYLAERMATLESLQGRKRSEAEDEVADHILRLWEHRHGAALRENPTALSDSVGRAIARLDPKGLQPWGFYKTFEEEAGPSAIDIEVNTLLRAALGLDRLMADLLRSLVNCAAMMSAEKDKEWVLHAQAAGADQFEYLRLVQDHKQVEDSDQSQVAVAKAKIVERSKLVIELLDALVREASEPARPEAQ
jgi:hypothetical protein